MNGGSAAPGASTSRGFVGRGSLACKRAFRNMRGAALFEYAIGVAAAAMITIGAVIPLFTEVRDEYKAMAEIVRTPPVFIIRQDGMSYSDGSSEGSSGSGDGDPTGWVGDDDSTGSTGDTGSSNEAEGDTDPYASSGSKTGTDGSDGSEDGTEDTGVCPAWSYFDFGFIDTRLMIQIHVPGVFIGVHGTNGKGSNKKSESINLEDVHDLGDETTTFVLTIEYDGVHEYFTDHNRISVFSLDGEKLINRALVRYESPGDIRQGDEYIIAHTQDLIIDLTGSLFGDREYNRESQTGNSDVGNNDTYLSFHDIGCVIYRPEE